MMRATWASRVAALAMFFAVLAWAGWLWHERKTLADYVFDNASVAPVMPFCEWVPVGSPQVVSLGVDTTSPPPWTDTRRALIAFRTGSRLPWYVDVGVVAVVGNGVTVSADGGQPRSIRFQQLPEGDAVRLPLSWSARDGVHMITIRVANARPPSGNEQRWLGIAISRIRVCDSLVGSS